MIFQVGLAHAGTTSLSAALKMLGYKSCHYSIYDKRLRYIIEENIEAGLKPFDGCYYDAFCDFAGNQFIPEIDKAYPDAKFIMTVRDYSEMVRTIEARRGYELQLGDKKSLQYKFNSLQMIREYFADRPYKLLEINITKGDHWNPICAFLGKEIPNSPFPHNNKGNK